MPLHDRAGFSFRPPTAIAVQPIEERRHAPVHDAMNMDRLRPVVHRLAERGKVIFVRRIERHRDVGISYAMLAQLCPFIRQRLWVCFEREVDHVCNTQCSEARHVLVLDTARCRGGIVQPLPRTNIDRIGAHCSDQTQQARGVVFHDSGQHFILEANLLGGIQPFLRVDQREIGAEQHLLAQLRVGILYNLRLKILW